MRSSKTRIDQYFFNVSDIGFNWKIWPKGYFWNFFSFVSVAWFLSWLMDNFFCFVSCLNCCVFPKIYEALYLSSSLSLLLLTLLVIALMQFLKLDYKTIVPTAFKQLDQAILAEETVVAHIWSNFLMYCTYHLYIPLGLGLICNFTTHTCLILLSGSLAFILMDWWMNRMSIPFHFGLTLSTGNVFIQFQMSYPCNLGTSSFHSISILLI